MVLFIKIGITILPLLAIDSCINVSKVPKSFVKVPILWHKKRLKMSAITCLSFSIFLQTLHVRVLFIRYAATSLYF
jgi:hypothetical protein